MKRKVVHYIESRSFGGAEQIVYNLLSGLDRSNWEPILVYHPCRGIAPLIDRVNELDIQTISLPAIEGNGDITGIIRFIKKLREIRPAIFHAHLIWNLRCSYGIFCAYLGGIDAIVATQHLYGEIRPRRLYKLYLLRFYQKIISMLVDRYIAVSYGQANHLKKAIISASKVEVVQNGINIEDFSRNRNNKLDLVPFGKNKGLPVVLTVARLDKYKGLTYLLEAASLVPRAVFLLAGEGPERLKLETIARNLNVEDRVIFLGHRNDIADLLKACDLFVLPSIVEGLPLTIIEAMSACKPVIATDIEGINEIIADEKTGLLVPPTDSGTLARKIDFLLSNPSLAKNLAVAGREKASNDFSSEKMVEGVTRVYEDIIEQKKR